MFFMQKELEDLVFRTPADTEFQKWWSNSTSKGEVVWRCYLRLIKKNVCFQCKAFFSWQ